MCLPIAPPGHEQTRQDSNLRMRESKSLALPLGYASICRSSPAVMVSLPPARLPRLRTHDTGASLAFESVSGGSLVDRLWGCINGQCWFPWARRRVCTGCSRRTARSPTCCPCLASSHVSVFPDCQQIISMTASWLILHNRNYTEPLEGDHSGLLTPSDCPVTGNDIAPALARNRTVTSLQNRTALHVAIASSYASRCPRRIGAGGGTRTHDFMLTGHTP